MATSRTHAPLAVSPEKQDNLSTEIKIWGFRMSRVDPIDLYTNRELAERFARRF
jgi:hypothetical protein